MSKTFPLLAAAAAGFLVGARDWRTDVMKADREFDLATSRRGADGWASYFAPDGKMILSDTRIVEGQKAVGDLMRPLFADPANSLRWQPEFADVAKSGDLGYTVGSSKRIGKAQDGALVESQGRYVTIWKKQRDGSWKVALDIGSSTAPRPITRPAPQR